MRHFIAIDLGTTNSKAVLIDETGKVLYVGKAAVVSLQDENGKHEQDAELIFQNVITLIKECFALASAKNIACISFSAAMHSIMATDTNGKPLTNAVTWADTRARQYAQQLRGSDSGKEIYRYTGTPIHAMSPLCKLLWLKNEKPEIFNNAAKFISVKEYIFFRFFGKYIVDEGMASATGLFNVYEHKWHEASLKLAGIDNSKLSQVVAATYIETEMLPEIKNELELSTNIPFVPGGNDGCLANLGCGALTSDIAVLTVGTSGAVRLTMPPSPPVDGGQEIANEGNGLFHYLLTDKIYVTGGPINNGGIVLQWFAENFLQLPLLQENNFEKVMQLAAAAKPGADDLLFLPYLLGERAPVWDESATGMFYGLRISHKKEHLTRAVVEGISFSLLQILKETEKNNTAVHSVYVSGAVTQSDFWMQLLADMFGKNIILNDVADASAMGAAFMGMYATGFIKDLSEVSKFISPSKKFIPNKEVHKPYIERFEVYKKLYPAFETINNHH